MKVSNYYKQHGRHGQPVQDLGRGQGVRPLPQDHDEVAGTRLNKMEFWTEFWTVSDIFNMILNHNKMFKCSYQGSFINLSPEMKDWRGMGNVQVWLFQTNWLKSWSRRSLGALRWRPCGRRFGQNELRANNFSLLLWTQLCQIYLLNKIAGNLKLKYLSNRTLYVNSNTSFEFYSFHTYSVYFDNRGSFKLFWTHSGRRVF